MDHTSNVAAIDSHAKRNRRHHHVDFLGGEAILRAPPLVGFHARVIGAARTPLRRQVRGNCSVSFRLML